LQHFFTSLLNNTAGVPGQKNKAQARIVKQFSLIMIMGALVILFSDNSFCQKLQLNDLGYFETPGFNIFVCSNQYTGMFIDEKNEINELKPINL
jgi:hypothetical protein